MSPNDQITAWKRGEPAHVDARDALAPDPAAVETHGQFQSVSISKMFIAGFLPGAVMAGGLLLMNFLRCKGRGYHGSSELLSLRKVVE